MRPWYAYAVAFPVAIVLSPVLVIVAIVQIVREDLKTKAAQ